MLNGIGGSSIREAKERLTSAEASRWFEYVQEYGSINIARRIDRGFALLAQLLCTVHGIKIGGQKPTIEDFLPRRAQQDEDEITHDINQAFAIFKGMSTNAK